jgi:hypothetical protein
MTDELGQAARNHDDALRTAAAAGIMWWVGRL